LPCFVPVTTNNRLTFVRWLSGFAAFVTVVAVTAAEPYLPENDNEVLESLPRAFLSGQSKLAPLRQQLLDYPQNADLASRLATSYMNIGNLEGDPRFYGYAQAAIHPWWKATQAPSSILRIRAKLKEKDHQYDASLADLELLVAQQLRDVQAWVEIANIYRVQGKYAKARQACDALSEFADSARSRLCRVPLWAVTGQAEEAYASVTHLLPTARKRWPGAVQWIVTMQAKIAWALGEDKQAEQHFREGLANNPADKYLMRAFADFLLDGGREKEVLSLLHDHTNDNGILLRAAIAARRDGSETMAADWQTQLEARFEEIELRGNQPHGRFKARYALELKNDPRRALELALGNWNKQKEARDTRNVLEAAIASGDRAAAQPVLNFLAEHDTEDVVLRRLARQLERNE